MNEINRFEIGDGLDTMRRVIEESISEINYRDGKVSPVAVRARSISKFIYLTDWSVAATTDLFDVVYQKMEK
jgi:hypothetical protein